MSEASVTGPAASPTPVSHSSRKKQSVDGRRSTANNQKLNCSHSTINKDGICKDCGVTAAIPLIASVLDSLAALPAVDRRRSTVDGKTKMLRQVDEAEKTTARATACAGILGLGVTSEQLAADLAAAPEYPPRVDIPDPAHLRSIAIDLIRPSKTNPRQSFDTPADRELVESIRAQGVLQTVLVRYFAGPSGVSSGWYQLVAGERRYRCALKAGLKYLPCHVKEMTDVQALEAQMVENEQDEPLSPLEQGAGYVALIGSMKKLDETAGQAALVEQVAKRIGKSVRYVYGRMKLVELAPEVKTALAEGKIEASHADELVRLKPEQQKIALRAMTAEPKTVPSVREVKKYIAEAFPRREKKLASRTRALAARPPCALCGRPFDDATAPLATSKPGECRVCHCTRKLPCHLGKKKPCHLLFDGVCSNPACRKRSTVDGRRSTAKKKLTAKAAKGAKKGGRK